MVKSISRRNVMMAGAVGMAAALPITDRAADLGYDPRTSAEGQIKLTATLDGSPAFWIYSGVVYALQPQQHPRAILLASGCQTSWAERQPDGSYRVKGATLTFFRDIDTGQILDSFDNPITGQRNQVKANFLSGASIIYPADGTAARAGTAPTKAAVIAPGGFNAADTQRPLGRISWRALDESIMLMTDHSWNVPVQPQLEAQTQTASKRGFFDPSVKRLPTRYTGTTIIPWMTWMEMGDTPGNLIWHTSGEKEFSLDGLEADYRAKAGDLMDRLAAKP